MSTKEIKEQTNNEAVSAESMANPQQVTNPGEAKKGETSPVMDEERAKRILASDRLSVKREIVEALIGIPYEFLKSKSPYIGELKKILDEASDTPRKRKVSLKISEFGPFVNDLIKFMFKFEGLVIATQRDVDAECYNKDMNKTQGDA